MSEKSKPNNISMKNIILFISTFCLLISCANAIAQTPAAIKISGKLTDTVTKKPIATATVTLTTDDTQLLSTLTQADGSFNFGNLKTGKYQLSIKSVGYLPVASVINIKADTSLGVICLKPDVKSLAEVQVKSSRPLIQQKPGKLIYDMQADPEAKARTLIDIFPRLPFVTVDADGNVMLKGSPSFKVFINGKPSAMMDNNLKNILRTMPASSIDRIEIITQPPAKYDAEGIGGIINIITKKSADDGYRGNINISERGPEGGPNGGGSFTIKDGKFGLNAYAGAGVYNSPQSSFTTTQQSYGSNASFLDQNGYRQNNSKNGYMGAELSYEIDSLRLLSGNFSYNGYGNTGSSFQTSLLTSADSVLQAYHLQNNSSGGGHGGDASVNYQLGFKGNKNQLLTLSYRYSGYQNSSINGQVFSREVNYPVANYRQPDTERTSEHTLQADYVTTAGKVNIELGGKAIFRADQSSYRYLGLDSASQQYIEDPTQSNIFHYSQDVYGLYNSYQFNLGKWNFSTGVRAEETVVNAEFMSTNTNVGQHYLNVIPSLAANRPLGSGGLNLGFNERLRRPSISRLNPFVDRSDPDFISTGNPRLKSSTMNDIQVGYSSGNSGKVSIFVATDYIFVNDLDLQVATFNPATQITSSTYQNIGQGHGYQLVGNINYTPVQWYRFGLNNYATYIMVEGLSGTTLLRQYHWEEHLSSSNTFRLPKGWTVDADVNYSGHNPQSLQGLSNAYFSTSLSVNKEVIKNKLTISAYVNNPFTKFRTNIITTTDPDFTEVNYNQVYFRSASISLNYNFGRLQSDLKKSRKSIRNDDLNNNKGGL